MNNFTIRDIERLSGIKAHTLRIWEQRHGLCFGKRKESQHRYYDNEDLKQILRVSFLYHNGYKISKIAHLSKEEIHKIATTNLSEYNYDLAINQMIEAGVDYNCVQFEQIIRHTSLQLGFEKAILKVFYPFLEKIGLLWITEHVIPAQEHFCSFLIQKEIMVAINGLGTARLKNDQTVIIFAPEGELHDIPLLVAQYILKKHGVKTVFFGSDTSIGQLEYYCRHKPVTHLYFHFITNFLIREPEEYLTCLSEKFPEKKIIGSGPALQFAHKHAANVKILRSMDEIIQVCTHI
jgi:DNA-binding transcriptional MerR regulator